MEGVLSPSMCMPLSPTTYYEAHWLTPPVNVAVRHAGRCVTVLGPHS